MPNCLLNDADEMFGIDVLILEKLVLRERIQAAFRRVNNGMKIKGF